MSIVVSTLGFPRIGPRRELKRAQERYWSGRLDREALLREAAALRSAAWKRQQDAGITHIPSNDFSFYDHVLDTTAMVGAIPAVYGWQGGPVDLDTYFAMARGTSGSSGTLPALEMTKWFDTNYHYMVPEFAAGQTFSLASTKAIDEYREAKAQGVETRPVLLGPVTYLLLGKGATADIQPLSLLPGILPVYIEVLKQLAAEGAGWVQIDEPCLVLDLDEDARQALSAAYSALAEASTGVNVLLTTYFGGLGDNLDLALSLPVQGLHLDLVRAPEQASAVLAGARPDLVLSLGVVDGRNVWRSNLSAILDRIEPIVAARGADRVMLAPSCSLLHVPIDLGPEEDLEDDVRSWLAFAVQKIDELVTLGRALDEGRESVAEAIAASDAANTARRTSPRTYNEAVRSRVQSLNPEMARRKSEFSVRRLLQQERLHLPEFPTTTIGSFPQTDEVRKAREANAKGGLSDADYEAFLRTETEAAVRWQEEIGIDVLVHGEFERNDMVQYFGEQLEGYAFTKYAWVQSYGSRCVRPPIIFGDVSRPHPMTVSWSSYAQSLTDKPMKGMLTGPVTMLQWSFVRDDQPRSETCRQIALALRDEVVDLEQAGIAVIQIDEPAVREGLPLRQADWQSYLNWAAECFRITASGVSDATQIHTHMCYAEFNDIIEAIAALDADVISIETARSRMELLEAFTSFNYPNQMGPGVWDIHSPRVPPVDEMAALLSEARERLGAEKLWVNPDCGLKTRKWEEVRPALANLVQAAKAARGV